MSGVFGPPGAAGDQDPAEYIAPTEAEIAGFDEWLEATYGSLQWRPCMDCGTAVDTNDRDASGVLCGQCEDDRECARQEDSCT